jgi:hypothetical protein
VSRIQQSISVEATIGEGAGIDRIVRRVFDTVRPFWQAGLGLLRTPLRGAVPTADSAPSAEAVPARERARSVPVPRVRPSDDLELELIGAEAMSLAT